MVPMNKNIEVAAIAGGILLVLVATMSMSLFAGTVVWLLWPSAALAFPGLVKDGTIAREIPWWSAVCLSWTLAILGSKSSFSGGEK